MSQKVWHIIFLIYFMVIIDCKAFNEKTRGKWVPKDVPGTGSDFEDHLFGSGELTLTDKVNIRDLNKSHTGTENFGSEFNVIKVF